MAAPGIIIVIYRVSLLLDFGEKPLEDIDLHTRCDVLHTYMQRIVFLHTRAKEEIHRIEK